MRPRDARGAYLNGQTAERAAAIVMQADRLGPGPDDADWLVAKAADDAAKRIEAAASVTEKTLAAIRDQMDRIEQRVDDLAKKPAAGSADTGARSAQLDAIESLQKEQGAQLRVLDALARRNGPNGNEGRVTRDLIIFMLAMLLTFAAALLGARFMAPISVVAALALGIALTLGYQYLAPIVLKQRG